MRYGFDKDGGFIVIDDETRTAAYAYPTSPNAEEARRSPRLVAARMMIDEQRFAGPEHIRAANYQHLSGKIS